MGFCVLFWKMYWTGILMIMTFILVFFSPMTISEFDSCPRSWQKVYLRGDTETKQLCLKLFNISATWEEASMKCKSENSDILSPYVGVENNDTSTFYFLRGVIFWTSLHVRGGGLIEDGFPPITPNEDIFHDVYIESNGADLDLECIAFERLYESKKYTFRNCSNAAAFYCYAPVPEFSASEELSFCPACYVGDFRFPKCYRYVSNKTSVQEAKQQCSTNGALAKFNISNPLDNIIAVQTFSLYEPFGGVWFHDLEKMPSQCSLLYIDMVNGNATSKVDAECESNNTYLCEAWRTTEVFQDIAVDANFTMYIQFDSGPPLYFIVCAVSRPLNSYEDLKIYKEKKQLSGYSLHRLNTVYSIQIMTNIGVSNSSFWKSAVQDIGEYRCEVYSLSRGLIASDSVYTDVRTDQVIKYAGSFRFQPDVPMYVYIPFNFGYSNYNSELTFLHKRIQDMLNFTVRSLNTQPAKATLYLKGNLTKICDCGQRAEFSLFVIPSVEKVLTAQDEITLREKILSDFIEYLKMFRERKRKRRSTYRINSSSVKIYSTVACSYDVYISTLDTYITYAPVDPGEIIHSEEICITDLQPLVSAKCIGGKGERAYVGEIQINRKCVYNDIFELKDDGTSILRNLSKVPVNESNAEGIAEKTANLTENEALLTTSDMIYTGVILNKIAEVGDVDESAVDNVVRIVSNVLEVPKKMLVIAQDFGSAGNRILESFDRIASNIILSNSTYRSFNERFAIDVRDIIPTEEPIIGIKLETSVSGAISSGTVQTFDSQANISVGQIDAAIVLPESVVKGNNNTRLVLQVYADTSLFITRKENRRYAIRGKVVAATVLVDGTPIRDLGDNTVKSIFTPTQTGDDLVCGFWNYSIYENSGGWATDGCMLEGIEDGRYICECDHLTNFAILVDISGQDDVIDKGNTLALSIITILGLGLSLIGLGLTIISFLLFKNMRKGRGQQTLFNLAVAMVCYIVVFLAGSKQTQSYGGCIAVAVLLHYFILAAFMWMLVEGVLQYLRFVKVLGTYIPNFMWKAAISAWGFPLIPVTIVLSVNYDSYKGGNSYCWMDRTSFYFAFLLPVCLILWANFIIFGLVLKNILQRPKGLQSNQSQRKQAMMNLRAGVAVLVVLGLTWLFGFLAISGARLTFLYIFTILNVLQGFLIFILFVAREKQFLKNWRTLCCKKKGSMYRSHSSEDSKTNPANKMNCYSCKSTSISNMDHESRDDNVETTLS